MTTPFRILRAFNDPQLNAYAGNKTLIGRNILPYFTGTSLSDAFIRELAHERALPIKEIAEAFEFFAAVRKHVRHADIVDLCCGHGLAGLLFAVFERKTERVLLCDRRQPKGFELACNAARRIAPWIDGKLQYVSAPLERLADELPAGGSVLAVHACGRLTDDCLAIARRLGGAAAVLPCCRSKRCNPAPLGLRGALGDDMAYDVHRTYAMEAAGHRVRWRSIPEVITPMNRVLIAAACQPASGPALP